jgi:hypothetical protein
MQFPGGKDFGSRVKSSSKVVEDSADFAMLKETRGQENEWRCWLDLEEQRALTILCETGGLTVKGLFPIQTLTTQTQVKYENETALEMFSIRSRTHQQAVNSCSSCFPPHTKHLRPGLHLCVSSSSSIALCFSTQRTLPTPAAHSYALS